MRTSGGKTRDGVASGRANERKHHCELIFKYGGVEFNMSYMTCADDLVTIEVLEEDNVKEALETDELLDECLNRCNLERHLENRCACLAAWGQESELTRSRRRQTGNLECSHRLRRTWEACSCRMGAARKRPKSGCARADEGAAGVAKFFFFFKRNVDHKWKLTLFKALVRGALTSAGESRCCSESDLKKLESKQCMLARRILEKRGYGKIKGQKATGVRRWVGRRAKTTHD